MGPPFPNVTMRKINIIPGSEIQMLNFYCQQIKTDNREYFRWQVMEPQRMIRILQHIRRGIEGEYYTKKVNSLIRDIVVGQIG
jgi:hypothetical protein